MATEYIVKRAGVNMKEVVTVPRIRYTTSLVGKSRENIKVEEHITEADVILSRELNKIPIIRPGSKLVVTISADGSVSGFYKIWREIDYDAITPKVKTISSDNTIKEREKLVR
jgi:hypothetical protein